MKLSLIAALCVLAAASASPIDTVLAVHGNAIDNLVREALEYVRTLMKQTEPFPVPDIPEQIIKDTDPEVDLKVKLKNLFVSKATDFTVDHIENNLIQLWAKFAVSVPTAHIDGEYNLEGTALDKKVSGNGHFSADVDKFECSGHFELDIEDNSIHMKEMDVDYSITNLEFNIDGLDVEGITKEQLNKLLKDSMLKFLQENKPLVSGKVAKFVQEEANKITKGKSLFDLIEWLKNFVHPTTPASIH